METLAELKKRKMKENAQRMKKDGVSYEEADKSFVEMMLVDDGKE